MAGGPSSTTKTSGVLPNSGGATPKPPVTAPTSNSPVTSGGQSLVSTLLSQIQPQLDASNVAIQQQALAAQLDPTLYGLSQTFAGQQYQNQLGQLGLSQQGLGLESGYQQQQLANQLAQLGLQGQGLGLEQGYLGQQAGFAGQQHGLTLGAGGVGGGGLEAQLANLAYQYPLAQQQALGGAGAQGATNTVGARNALGQLAESQQYNVGNLQNQIAQANLGYQQQQASLGYQGGQLGLAQKGLGLQTQAAQQAGAYQQAQLGLQQQGLGLERQAAGQQFGYQQATGGIAAAMQGAQDTSALAAQIANQVGMITQAAAPLSILQGMNLPAQSNPGN